MLLIGTTSSPVVCNLRYMRLLKWRHAVIISCQLSHSSESIRGALLAIDPGTNPADYWSARRGWDVEANPLHPQMQRGINIMLS